MTVRKCRGCGRLLRDGEILVAPDVGDALQPYCADCLRRLLRNCTEENRAT